MDFWSEVGPRTEQVDIMVEPQQVDRLAAYLAIQGVHYQVCGHLSCPQWPGYK